MNIGSADSYRLDADNVRTTSQNVLSREIIGAAVGVSTNQEIKFDDVEVVKERLSRTLYYEREIY
uniref:Uncharacterized protein n=1 Tax=Romanomermis culicivorax TaxID=13658 RepID=A0A915I7C2_ROMCU